MNFTSSAQAATASSGGQGCSGDVVAENAPARGRGATVRKRGPSPPGARLPRALRSGAAGAH
eukprot:7894492-Alexandrium_andersonii.AAC.1